MMPAATAKTLKNKAWRRRTGFDSIVLTADQPIPLVRTR